MTVKNTAYIALFAAIIAMLGLLPKIDVPILPVPITAQLLGVMLAGCVLGPVRGAVSVLLFLALVAVGLPLLSGGRGGLGVFFGPSAGFLFTFPVGAFLIGALTQRYWSGLTFWHLFAINVLGGIVIICGGIVGLVLIGGLEWRAAALGSVVFLPGDLIKAALAASAGLFVKRGYPLLHSTRGRDS